MALNRGGGLFPDVYARWLKKDGADFLLRRTTAALARACPPKVAGDYDVVLPVSRLGTFSSLLRTRPHCLRTLRSVVFFRMFFLQFVVGVLRTLLLFCGLTTVIPCPRFGSVVPELFPGDLPSCRFSFVA